MKKKIISTLLAVTLTAAALAGCGSSSGGVESEPAATEEAPAAEEAPAEETPAAEEEATAGRDLADIQWGFIVGSFEHVFYQNVAAGIEAGCQELGLDESQYNVTDCNLEAEKATNAIENFTANGCNSIALACNDAAGCVPGINAAAAAGVNMFNFDSKADDLTNVISFVGTDNYQGGVIGAQELIRLTEEGDTVAIIGNPESVSTQDREQGCLDTLAAEAPDRNVIHGNNYDGDAIKAQEIMETILISNPEVKAVFTVGDPAATGALAAIKAAGSSCLIIGFDGNPEAKEAMLDAENGKYWVSEVAQDPEGIGRGIVEQMYKYYTTGQVDDQVIMIDPYAFTAEDLK